MTESFWETWVSSYLYDPSNTQAVEGAVGLVRQFTRGGGRATQENTGAIIAVAAFISRVWARWPDQAEGFFRDTLARVPDNRGARGIVYMMAALCPPTAVLLDSLEVPEEEFSELRDAQTLRDLFGTVQQVKAVRVISPWHMDLLWGSFFGSGDSAYVIPIFEAASARAGGAEGKTLQKQVLWSIARHEDHPEVCAAVATIFELKPQIKEGYERARARWR